MRFIAWGLLGKDKMEETTKKPVVEAAKAGTVGISPLALILALPAPYNHWAAIGCSVLAGAGLAATQISLPANQSGKWWWLYKAINFLASNWKQAANAAIVLKGSTSTEKSKTEVTK